MTSTNEFTQRTRPAVYPTRRRAVLNARGEIIRPRTGLDVLLFGRTPKPMPAKATPAL